MLFERQAYQAQVSGIPLYLGNLFKENNFLHVRVENSAPRDFSLSITNENSMENLYCRWEVCDFVKFDSACISRDDFHATTHLHIVGGTLPQHGHCCTLCGTHFTRLYSHVQHHRVFRALLLLLQTGRLEHARLQCLAAAIRDVEKLHLWDMKVQALVIILQEICASHVARLCINSRSQGYRALCSVPLA